MCFCMIEALIYMGQEQKALTEMYILKFILYWYKVKSTIFLNGITESFSPKALTER